MQGHAVVWSGIDALDDVDFATLGPGLLAEEPHCGPRAAGKGDVEDVGDEEAAVVGFCGLEADAGAAEVGARVEGGVSVNAEVDGVVFTGDGANEVLGGGGIEVDVFDEAVCWVLVGEEVEFGEEIVTGVVVGEGIAGYACLNEGCTGQQRGKCSKIHSDDDCLCICSSRLYRVRSTCTWKTSGFCEKLCEKECGALYQKETIEKTMEGQFPLFC